MFKLHWGVPVNSEVPTTGVLTNHKVEHLSDEIFNGDSIDLAQEEHQSECAGLCEGCHCNHSDGGCGCYGVDEHEYEPDSDNHDGCAPEDMGTVLIGSWKKDEATGQWEPDKTGEYAAIVGEIYTQVVWSKYSAKCALCSPCYPGQADLENEGEFLAFTLPPEIWGESNPHKDVFAADTHTEPNAS